MTPKQMNEDSIKPAVRNSINFLTALKKTSNTDTAHFLQRLTESTPKQIAEGMNYKMPYENDRNKTEEEKKATLQELRLQDITVRPRARGVRAVCAKND